ncbi:autotransporter-associated beta strand repeat-containing protein [Pseudomonas sp. 5P_3.1_Bac2]|uniref:autotransporter-associated beta strand repeat-containing protein n=1 Tax=Pseudomonas sp. 5P_3.1_Bac2 TaxID=2971617 RepID=UPI0021C61672|nr:autotransporter-associated beta strand repeat-containing protein [Pseudomonas sp. 5P_3.1_Bac2]MCU1717247.1 autotransporter-associated beta strand repeat-containing protein [Pseudomonas sp. 5P_3.1_Bac2]
MAACTPNIPILGETVNCNGTDQQNFASSASNLTVNVIGSAIVSSDGSGDPVLQLTGSNNIVVNSGQIYPSYSGQQSLPTTGLKVGNSSTQNITISNNPTGSISGTGANPGASIVDLKGMALDVEAGAGGKVTIVNHGTIFTNVIVGGTLEVANMPTVAVYGGAQVEMFNTNTAYGRIAFQASAEGNTFTNSGSLGGSLSMGAGGGNNRFNAITGSGVQASGVSGASSVTVASNPNLVFLAPGIVDGGAGGSNTLALQNAIGGGSGSGGSGTIFAANFLNFSNLLVQSGSWTVSGALLTGATTSTRLSGGALWVNNSGVFGTGIVNANGATLSSFAASTLILANDINLEVNALSGINGLTVSGSNNITLSGVISGDGTSPLTKTGTGVLRLDGTNTYSGGTALNAGSLIIGSSQALGTGAVSAATGTRIDSGATATLSNIINLTGTVNFGGTGNLTLSGALLGNASAVLNKDGAGTLVLSNASTYGGGTTLAGGTLLVGNNTSLGGGALTVSGPSSLGATQSVMLNNAVALNSNLTVSGDFALRLNGNITGGAANKLIKSGLGNLTLTGTSNFQGGVELNGGTLTVATNSGALGSGALTATGDSRLAYTTAQVSSTSIAINSDVTLEFANDVQIIHMGQITGTATSTLVKSGTEELMLFNANAFSGLLDVRQGTVTAAVANALGNNPNLLVGSGATVALTASNSINSLSGAGQVTVIAGSTFTVGAGNASSTFSGALSGLGALTKSGTGTLTLSGISGLSGNTTVSAGRLNIASSGSLASNLVTVANGATLGGSGTLTGGVTINSGGHLAVTSGSTLNTGTLTLASGSNLDIGLGTPTIATPMLNVTGNVAINNSTFNFSDAGGLANGTYRLINYTGTLNYGGANPGIFPADVVLGQITLSMDNVAKTANIVVNSSALAIQYWDGISLAGNGAVEGGSGVWNATNTNWTKSSGAINGVWTGVSAVFQAASGTVVIEGSQSVSALQFKTDGYALTAGTAGSLNLINGTGGSALVIVDSGLTALIEAPVGGTGKLQKSGAGSLVLAGSNSYTGGTSLSAGTLVLRNNSALGSSALSLASGTYLRTDISDVQLSNGMVFSGVSNIQVDAGTTLTLNGAVSGAGGLFKIGTGTLALNGNNSQLGNIWLNAGGLVLGNSGALGAGELYTSGGTTLDSSLPGAGALVGNNVALNSDLTVLGTRDMSLSGIVSGSGNLIKNGASTLSLTGSNTLNGTVTLNQGTLRLGQNTSLGNTTLTVGGASTLQAAANIALSNAVTLNSELTVAGSSDLTLNGVVSGAGGLVKDGSGMLTLSGNNLFQGNTTLNAGTLVLGNANALGAGRLDVAGTAALESSSALTVGNDVAISGNLTVQGSNNLTLDGSVTGMGSLTKAGTGTLTLNGGNGFYGIYNINGGRLISNTNVTLGEPNAINVAAGATLQLIAGAATDQLNGAGNVQLDAGEFRVDEGTFSGALSGNGTLYKNGSGTLLLSGNSNLTGATTVAGGTLRVNGNLGSASVSVENGATLAGSGAVGGAVTVANGGHLGLAGGSVLTLGNLGLNSTANLDVALGTATPGAAGLANVIGNLTLDGKLNITNTGGFGIGVYRLFDYGGLLIDNGLQLNGLPIGIPANELKLQSSVANQINLVVGGSADIRFWDGSQLTGNGTVEGGSGTWNSTNSNWTTSNAILNGAWNNTFAVFQGAAGTVSVDGNQSVNGLQFSNDYTLTGGSAGELQLVNGIGGYTAVRVDSGKIASLDVNLSGAGMLNKLDSGTLVLNNANTYSGGTQLNAGTLVLGNAGALGSGSLTTFAGATLDSNTALSLSNTLNLNGALTLGGSHDLVLNGLVLGNGALVKNGSATLTLNQGNNYAGTTLNAGTLLLGHNAALGTGQLTVAGVSKLASSAAMSVGNAIHLDSRLTLASQHDLTLSGALSGNGTLLKQGVNNLNLTGSSNFNGTYQIDAGRLNLQGSNTSSAAQVLLNAAGTLGVDSHNSVARLDGLGTVALANNSLFSVAAGNFAGALGGNGSLVKTGSGTLNLSGSSQFSGSTEVAAGTLALASSATLNTSALSVASGATLSGTGNIGSAVTVADNAHLLISSGNTLTTGNLSLGANANLDALLGAPITGAPGMLKVNGDLALDGILNIRDAGGFGLGVYRLADYSGTLTDNGLSLGNLPGSTAANQLQVQTSIANQINLVVEASSGSALQFWNGNNNQSTGIIHGGDGVWGDASNWSNANGSQNSTWDSQFAVFGGIGGTVTVLGQQAFSGLQFLSNGYQLIGAQGNGLNPINSSAGSAAVIRVDNAVSVLISAAMGGQGGIEKLDSGTLILTGSNSYSGGTTVSGGTLQGNSNSLQGSILNNADLIFQQNVNGTFSGTLNGTGTAFKRGAGTLLFTGDHSFSGTFIIQEGVLQVGQMLASAPPVAARTRMALFAAPLSTTLAADVVVANGAGLTGTGTVNSVINKGTVQPGPNGNLSVTGNFTNESNGTLSIALTPLPTSYLAVGGSANLAGTLNLLAPAAYTGDTTYTLLSAAGGINGKFASNNLDSLGGASNLAFIDTTLTYGSHDVSLSVARNDVAFADVARNDNQRSTAAALDSAAAPATLRSTITSMDRASAQAAFASLSGEIHASTASALVEDSRYLRNSVNDRMRQGDCSNLALRNALAPASAQSSSSGCQGQGVGWFSALGGRSQDDGSAANASTERDLSGFMLGYDNNLNEQWRAGIAAGQTNTSLKASTLNSDSKIDSYHLSSYLSYQLDAFAARLGIGYTWHNIDSKRQVAAGAYSEQHKGKYKAETAQVFSELAYTTQVAGVALEPFAALAYVDQRSAKGKEHGGAARLEAQVQHEQLFSTLGLRVAKPLTLANGTELTPRASIGWRHAYGDTTPDADLRFVDGGAAFSNQGVPIAKDAAVLEAGLDVSVGVAGKLGLGYSGQLSSDNRDHALTLSFSLGF